MNTPTKPVSENSPASRVALTAAITACFCISLHAEEPIPDIDSSGPSIGKTLSSAIEAPKKESPAQTPRPKSTPKPVKSTPKPKPKPAPAATPTEGPAVVGKPFKNPDGILFEFRSKDDKGQPFWRSALPVLSEDAVIATEYCRRVTDRDRSTGTIPTGYAYFPSVARDGRMVLAVSTTSVVPISVPPLAQENAAVPVARAQPASPASQSASGPTQKQNFTNGAGMLMQWRQLKTMGYWVYLGPITPALYDSVMGNPQHKWPGNPAQAGALIAGKLDPEERAAGRVPPGWGYRLRDNSEICLLPL